LPVHFSHNPYEEETEEQIQYRKAMSAESSGGSSHAEAHGGGFHSTERSLFGKSSSSAASGGSAGGSSSLGFNVKGIFSDGKAAFKSIKTFVSLDSKLSKDICDPSVFPEVAQTAQIRRGLELCPEESQFLAERKRHVRDHFARYMGWDPAHVHPDDVPTIAFGGSGGGYRAMLAVLGYSAGMKKSGLWDLLTYVSGVSGSCTFWTLVCFCPLIFPFPSRFLIVKERKGKKRERKKKKKRRRKEERKKKTKKGGKNRDKKRERKEKEKKKGEKK
jgi:hypothetical protein